MVIGDDCLISNNLTIYDANHGMNAELPSYHNQPQTVKNVKIGNGCWIGEKVTMLPGADVGDHSIIGTNSVVTGIIPAYSIAVGVPARVIKEWNFDNKTWDRVIN